MDQSQNEKQGRSQEITSIPNSLCSPGTMGEAILLTAQILRPRGNAVKRGVTGANNVDE